MDAIEIISEEALGPKMGEKMSENPEDTASEDTASEDTAPNEDGSSGTDAEPILRLFQDALLSMASQQGEIQEEADPEAMDMNDDTGSSTEENAVKKQLLEALAAMGSKLSKNNVDDEEVDKVVQSVKDGIEAIGVRDYSLETIPGDQSVKVIRFSSTVSTGRFTAAMVMRTNDRIFTSYVRCQLRVPEAKRQIASDFLTYANYGLTLGNFELDHSDGEVGFKAAVPYMGSELSKEMVKQMAGACFSTMDRYLPGLMAVSHAGKDPKVAADDCEHRG